MKRLGVRISLIQGSIIFIIIALSGFFSYITTKASEEKRLMSKADRDIIRVSTGIASPLYGFDDVTAGILISLEMESPDVMALLFRDGSGVVSGKIKSFDGEISDISKEEEINADNTFYSVNSDVIFSNENLGNLTIYYWSYQIEQE